VKGPNIGRIPLKDALDADGGLLVAGENYGQESSKEHAALCPMYLGVEEFTVHVNSD